MVQKTISLTKTLSGGGIVELSFRIDASDDYLNRPAEILHTADEVSGNEQNGGQDCSDNDIGELFNDIHRNADCA